MPLPRVVKEKPAARDVLPLIVPRQKGKCHLCKEKIERIASLATKVPIGKGGSWVLDNMIALHPKCGIIWERYRHRGRKAMRDMLPKARKRMAANKCIECGKKLDDYMSFCLKCETKLVEQRAASS